MTPIETTRASICISLVTRQRTRRARLANRSGWETELLTIVGNSTIVLFGMCGFYAGCSSTTQNSDRLFSATQAYQCRDYAATQRLLKEEAEAAHKKLEASRKESAAAMAQLNEMAGPSAKTISASSKKWNQPTNSAQKQ